MPCTMTGSFEGDAAMFAEEALEKARKQLAEREAMLCAVLSVIEAGAAVGSGDPNALAQTLDAVNFKEGGFTRSRLERWWAQHKKADAKRRKAER